MSTVKEIAKSIAEGLPDTATLEDFQHQVEIRKKMERAEEDERTGRFFSSEEVKDRIRKKTGQ